MTKEAQLAQKITEYLYANQLLSTGKEELAQAIIRRFLKDANNAPSGTESNNEQ